LVPQLTLQPNGKTGHICVILGGQRLVCLRNDDREGLKVITTWSVDGQIISADLMDRRHFNPGQQTDYRMEPHKPALIRQATLNLVRREKNSERGLAAQLGHVVDDRTVGRHLKAMGWRAAEEAGLAEEVSAYVDAERRRAYWAGVAGESLESVLSGSSPGEW
jgi:hypothetical protein